LLPLKMRVWGSSHLPSSLPYLLLPPQAYIHKMMKG